MNSKQLSHSQSNRDFKSAYRNLVKQMYEQGGSSSLVTAEEVRSVKFYDSLSRKDFQNRNQLFLQQKQEKLEKGKQLKLEEELSECTFKPTRKKS